MIAVHRSSRGFTFVELIIFMVIVLAALLGVLVAANQGIRQGPRAFVEYRTNELANVYMDEILSRRHDHNRVSAGNPSACTPESPLGAGVVCSLLPPGYENRSCLWANVGGKVKKQNCTDPAAFGPEGESRAEYNDVDDYHGLREGPCYSGVAGASSDLLDSRGNVRQGFPGFCVAVDVKYDGNFNDVDEIADGSASCASRGLLETPHPVYCEREVELSAKLILVTITNPSKNEIYFSAYRGAYSAW